MKYSLRSLMQFSLRDLFWITVVVAMGVAWWLDRSRVASQLGVYKQINDDAVMEWTVNKRMLVPYAPAKNPPKK